MEKFTFNDLNAVARIFKAEGIIAFPTETVYGLGAIYDSREAYDRLNKIKGRSPEKPYSLMCAHRSDIYKLGEVNELADKIIAAFIPGELTIVLKAKVKEPSWIISSDGWIGFRVSADPDVQKMIDFIGKPILATSVNKSGEQPLTGASEVIDAFGSEIDGIILGDASGSRPSTVVKVDEGIEILREGKITRSQIEDAIRGEK